MAAGLGKPRAKRPRRISALFCSRFLRGATPVVVVFRGMHHGIDTTL